MKTHKDLDVWKESINLVENIYKITESFPRSEIFALTNQMRRASVSISSNIAEGAARKTYKEFIYFLYVALGSCSELETQIIIAERLCFIDDNASSLKVALERIIQMLHGLIRNVRRREA